jgi:phenylpyruvate tautomerase PptA (4-oxalocrotonate tautomerase family)
MPYLEILARNLRLGKDKYGADTRALRDARSALAREMTAAVVSAFSVLPAAVTLFFVPLNDEGYAHEGVLAADMSSDDPRRQRIFVKVHAYARSIDQRRMLAAALTPLLARYYDASAEKVAIYFFERDSDEVAHGGRMAADS